MKARWEVKCGRCGKMIHVGDLVSTTYGNFWHLRPCTVDYKSERARQSLVASAQDDPPKRH